jgi:hypothetical protein
MEQASEPEPEDARLIVIRVVLLALAAVGSVVLSVSTLLAVGWLSVAVIVVPIVGLVSGVGWFIGLAIERFRHSSLPSPGGSTKTVAVMGGISGGRSRQGPGGLDASRDISRS